MPQYQTGSESVTSAFAELRDFEPDDHQEIEVDEGNTAVIECHLPESQPKAQVRYSVKQEWLETSKGTRLFPRQNMPRCLCSPLQSDAIFLGFTGILKYGYLRRRKASD